MSRNDDYTTANLLDQLYHQNCYKLIGIDKQMQVFLKKLILQENQKKNDGSKKFFITEEQQKNHSKLFRFVYYNRII